MDAWTTQAEFSILRERLGLPPELVQRLWAAVETVPDKNLVQARMEEAFREAPTYEDFCGLLQRLGATSVRGMSVVTHSMIKAWQDASILFSTRNMAECCAIRLLEGQVDSPTPQGHGRS